MNAQQIAAALTSVGGPFPFQRYVCVPNVSWGLVGLPGEADLLALAPSGYLYEVEIKTSIADYKREAAKAKHRQQHIAPRPSIVRGFYFALPLSIAGKAMALDVVPGAGYFAISDDEYGFHCDNVRSASLRRARKLTIPERAQLMRLGVMRYWSRATYQSPAQGNAHA
jgi:hypothetical protein